MELEPYVVDVLMPDLVGHDRQPSAFLTYLYLYRHARHGAAELSLRQVAEGTGLSKRAVQGAIARLETRGLLAVTRRSVTSVGAYEVRQPWIDETEVEDTWR